MPIEFAPSDLARLARCAGGTTVEDRCAAFVAALWPTLSAAGASWAGFYLDHPEAPDAERLVLGAREPKPACSPIGLHGACGRCLLSRSILVVRDVASLGAGYVACDPRDRSELVLPCLRDDGSAWGVFDLDSFDVGCFSPADGRMLWTALVAAGLTTAGTAGHGSPVGMVPTEVI
jgi:putative methionine-R-sulfoxide reductase with GAF domain